MFKILHVHSWSDWEESSLNKYTGHHIKTVYRYCRKCGDTEDRVLSFDCTKYKRVGKWCNNCKRTAEIEKIIKLGYNVDMDITIHQKRKVGRPKNINNIKIAKELHSQGFSIRQIASKMASHRHSVWRWIKYEEEKFDMSTK